MILSVSPEGESERAVSPVIGVILMVAITVILAAVIAAFVLDLGQTSSPPQANLEVDENSDGDLTVLIRNADRLDDIEIRGCSGTDAFSLTDNDMTSPLDDDISVGDRAELAGDNGEFTTGEFKDVPDDGCGGETLNFVAIYDGSDSIITSVDYEGDS